MFRRFYRSLQKGRTMDCEHVKTVRQSVESWRYVFAEMASHFKDRNAGSITPDEAQDWIRSLAGKRSPSTVRKNWITASRTIFGWALEHKRISRNPFADVKITVPKKHTPVRNLGVSDPELLPNHAWRHTFKQIADRAGISERMSDYITGHAHKSAGAGYGAPILSDMAQALNRFPRYKV